MIRLVFFGFWSCLTTTAAVVAGQQMLGTSAEVVPTSSQSADRSYTQPKQLVAPLVHNGEVLGYLFSTAVLGYTNQSGAELSKNVEYVMHDTYHSVVMGNPAHIVPVSQKLNMASLETDLLKRLNENLSGISVKDVILSDVNYLARHEIRSKVVLKTIWLQEMPSNQATSKKSQKAKNVKKDH